MDQTELLRRLKRTEPVDNPDIRLLNDLCIAWVSTIPFENLDMFGGGSKRAFDLQEIYNRIVINNRGGFCFELNGLLHWLLSSLGFKVDMCMASGLDEKTDTFRKSGDHMVLIVTFKNGTRWLTDVGWGGTSFVFPLDLGKLDVDQSQPNGVYKIKSVDDGIYIVEKKKQTQIHVDGKIVHHEPNASKTLSKYQTGSEWGILYGFTEQSHARKDFDEGFEYAQEGHPFMTKNSCAVLQDRDGRLFLISDTLVEKEYIDPNTVKVTSIHKCNQSEMKEVLKDRFNLTIDFELLPTTSLHWTAA